MDYEKILTYVLLGALIACIGGVIYLVVTPQEGEHFTEFYVLGPDGKAADYPTDLIQGETGEVILGVVNREWEEVNYRTEINLENRVLENYRFRLGHKDNWIRRISFAPQTTGENLKLQFLLFKENSENVYRDLHLWIDVAEIG